ncbi:uncharacterized protein V1513DRAFT_423258 [Lipomyces chichibuensis]|uniref:uncharacterized protein n=1 Tax=Lipomyces chichibuensis TaxID=1546026 RepID=UPI003343B1C9
MSEGPILFSYRPQQPFPNSVAVAGEFNSWSPTPLIYSDESSRFETTVMLEDGKSYRYKFVIDGNWILAPDAETVWENGIENSIIRVTSDKFVKSASERDPEAPAAESQVFVSESEAPVTEPETPAAETEAPAIEREASAAEPETPANEAPVTEPEAPGAVTELVSSSVITSEGYVLVHKNNVELTKAAETAESLETKVEEEAAPIEPTVNEAAVPIETDVVGIVASADETPSIPADPEVVDNASESALTPSSEEAASVPDVSASPSEMSSIERVVTANTTITTPEFTTPVQEDVNKKLLPDAISSSVLEVSAESSLPEVPAETPPSATPAIPAEPSTGSPKEPAVVEAITAGNDTAISIPAVPGSDPAPAGPQPAYKTATQSKQPGLLDMIYDFVSTSILGKLFQYVFSIFNRSA